MATNARNRRLEPSYRFFIKKTAEGFGRCPLKGLRAAASGQAEAKNGGGPMRYGVRHHQIRTPADIERRGPWEAAGAIHVGRRPVQADCRRNPRQEADRRFLVD